MNVELVKYGSGLVALAIAYTIISVSDKENGVKFQTGSSFELRNKIENGKKEILSELRKLDCKKRELKTDIDRHMDNLSNSVVSSNSKATKDLKYLRGITTQTHIDVELMEKTWNFNVTDDERVKCVSDMVAAWKAGQESSKDEA